MWIEKLGTSLAYKFETTDLRFVQVYFGLLLNEVVERRQEDVWERLSEVAAVKVGGCLHANSALVLLHHVDLVALGAEDLHAAAPQFLTEADWDTLLIIAQRPRARSELAA